jgi:hypothetical protein
MTNYLIISRLSDTHVALGIEGIFTHEIADQQARNIATLLNQGKVFFRL